MRGKGFSLIELLLAMAILILVLSVALLYFRATSRSTALAQAKGELQDRVRYVMQVVTGDLGMSGARYWTQGGTSLGFTLVGAIKGQDGSDKDTLTVRYVTSLRDMASACRRVDYGFNGDTLMRSDVNITSGTDCLEGSPSFAPFAEGILALDIQYLCSDGRALNTPNCEKEAYSGEGAYLRSARVTVAAYSLTPIGASPMTLETVTGQRLDCPAKRLCYAMTQEVLMPNLKPVQ